MKFWCDSNQLTCEQPKRQSVIWWLFCNRQNYANVPAGAYALNGRSVWRSCSSWLAEQSAHRDQEEGHDGLPPPQLPPGRGDALQVREAPGAHASAHSCVWEQPTLHARGALNPWTLSHVWLCPVFTAEPQSPWQKILPPGTTLGRTPSTLLLEPGKPGIGFILQAAVLPGVAEHAGEAGEDMTNGRTLMGRFCREHWLCRTV